MRLQTVFVERYIAERFVDRLSVLVESFDLSKMHT